MCTCYDLRTDALVLVAGLVGSAVYVGLASRPAGHALADLPLVTLGVALAHRLAEAAHAQLVGHAVGVLAAHGRAEAQVALEVLLRALLVRLAGNRLAHAAHGGRRVGEESLLADAVGLAVVRLAERVRAAAGHAARVHALVPDAGLGRGAVGLLAAAHETHLVQADVAEEAVVVDAARH